MKFGQHLLENIAPEYGLDAYLEYDRLDRIIRELSKAAPSRYATTDIQLRNLKNIFLA
jgi:SPX domain protein involved in polyphosphate accumulation